MLNMTACMCYDDFPPSTHIRAQGAADAATDSGEEIILFYFELINQSSNRTVLPVLKN